MTRFFNLPSLKQVQPTLERWRPVDALLPISICLHMYKSSREAGVGLLVVWLAWRLLEVLLNGERSLKPPVGFQGIIGLLLGLLLVNARIIALRDDVQGPSQFLLIALGFVIGSLLAERSWRITLGWLSVATLPLLWLFLVEAHASLMPLMLTQIEAIYSSTMRGHGGINRFATLVVMLTTSAWYFTLLAQTRLARVVGVLSLCSGYVLCLGSGSRTAIFGAPLAAFLAWGLTRLQGRRHKMLTQYLVGAGSLFVALLLWWFVLSPEAAINRTSDLYRAEAARCWLSIMFSGKERFLFGIGYGSEVPNRICHHIPDFRGQYGTIGHAHNTFAHIAGQHGLLGLIALLIFLLLILQGLRRQFIGLRPLLPRPLSPKAITWPEAALGLNLVLAMNFVATTIHISNQINQVLIGLLAASALSTWPLVNDVGVSGPPPTSPSR